MIVGDRWRQVKPIFERAVALEGEVREAWLREACRDDSELLIQIRGMLEADKVNDTLLDHGAREAIGSEVPTSGTERVSAGGESSEDGFASYRLLEKIGEGGMGEVWLAEQQEPVRRRVAIKIIKRGMDTDRVTARFAAEQQALAMMEHPAIAHVFDAGSTLRGRPYFAMEYVPGTPITEHCDRERLDTRERIELFVRVCDGVQHAHQKGIIHRDIKPSNVLIALQDGVAVPKIIDFGVAKAIEQRLTEQTLHTETGVLIGTPEYMSPEQADLTEQNVDTRTDVYALGVLLYELLAGALPFDAQELRDASFDEIRRRIREVDPPTPSTRVVTTGAERTSEMARARRTDPSSLKRQLQGDLDWITMRALEKERKRRYGSPSELAADLKRHLADKPVEAGPPDTAYRMRKFVRRHRLGATFAALLVMLLIGFMVTLAVQARRIALQRDRANQIAAELDQVATFQAEQLSGIVPELLGIRLRDSLLKEGRATFGRTLGDAAAIDLRMAELEQTVLPFNFTNVAIEMLEENIFDRALATIDAQFKDQPRVRARLLQTVADTLREVALWDKADLAQTEALRLRRLLLGDAHPDTLESIDGMARIRRQHGQLAEARLLFKEVIEGRTRVLGPDHPDTLGSIVESAEMLTGSRSKLERALGLRRDEFERARQGLPAGHPVAIKASLNLGRTLTELGMHEEGEKQLRLTYESALIALGPRHPIATESAFLLGAFLWRAGRLDEAEPYIRQVLASRREMLGDNHSATVEAMSLLVALLETEGRLDEAESLAGEAFEASLHAAGPDSVKTMVSQHNLGFVQYKQGKLEEAETNLRDVLERRRRIQGDDHQMTISTIGNLALVLVARGRADEAEPLAREAVELGVEHLGVDHWVVGNCRGQLGLAIAAQERFAEAEYELLAAHQVLLDALGDGHERTQRVSGYLVDLYTAWQGAVPDAGLDESAARWRRVLTTP